jgi:hypothetical protein
MNNEPVAWMVEDDEDISFIMNGNGFAKPDASWKSVIPVYTHPAKTLTDEEINKTYLEKYDGHMGFLSPDEVREFAKAILRKAQEK